MAADTARPRGGRGPGAARALRLGGRFLERYGVVLVLGLLILIYSIALPDTFPTYRNFTTIVSTQDILAILAIGSIVPLAAGEFDLSIAATLGFCGMEVAWLMNTHGWGAPEAIIVTLLTALGIGAANGFLVVVGRINAFIATLGVSTVLSGLTIWISGGGVIIDIPNSLTHIAQKQVGNLPYTVFYMFGVVIIFYYLMVHTPFGRYLYAIGGGREAARLAGIKTGQYTALSFVASAFLAGLAGVLETATLGAAHPDIGPQFLLPAFAAAFLGATTIQPGRFNVVGTVVAIFLLAVGIAGLQQLGAEFWVTYVFNGLALILAVGIAVRRGTSSLR